MRKDLPRVSFDGEQIKQVLLNLAINSLQAMPDGGKLSFRTFEKDGFSVVEVEDNGVGIDEKITGKIFDPFFTTKEKGVGLGLSIAHKIADQHQGKLTANNQKGKTVFSFFLLKSH